MEIGIDEEDLIDEISDFESDKDIDQHDTSNENQEDQKNQENQEDFLTSLLKSRGIEDRSKIKFEMGEGSIEEVDWDNLSNEDS